MLPAIFHHNEKKKKKERKICLSLLTLMKMELKNWWLQITAHNVLQIFLLNALYPQNIATTY